MSGLFGGLADEADRFISTRIDRLAVAARQQTDRLAEHVGERFAGHLVEQLANRFAARLAWVAAAVGAVVISVWLLAVGLAGAIGEFLGREWLGQLAAGVITLLVAGTVAGITRLQARRRKAAEAAAAALASTQATSPGAAPPQQATDAAAQLAGALGRDAVQAGSDLVQRHPVASVLAVSAAGLLAGTVLGRSNGRSREDD